MQKIVCPTKLIHPKAHLPTRSTEVAGGYDIYCVAGLENLDELQWPDNTLRRWEEMALAGFVELQPQESMIFRTGMLQAIQHGYVGLLHDRSGMGAKKRIGRLAGVIDEDYRGEWFVCLVNHSSTFQVVTVGDKICQVLYQERVEAEFPTDVPLPDSVRGTKGFGSSGQ